MKLNVNSLVTRLILSFLGLSLITVLIVAYMSYNRARASLTEAVYDRLTATLELKENALNNWIEEKMDDLLFVWSIPEAKQKFLDVLKSTSDSRSPEYIDIYGIFHSLLINHPDFYEIFLLSRRGGEILISSNLISEGDFRVSDTYYIKGINGIYLQDIYLSPVTFKPTITLATPVRDEYLKSAGVLAAHLDLERMDRIIFQSSGLGETGEAYLVDSTNTFVAGREFGRAEYPRGAHSEGIKRALEGRSGTGLYRNYAGENVVGAYRWIPKRNLALVAELSQSEAFYPARRLAVQILVLGFVVSMFLAFAIRMLAYRITRPILAVKDAADRLSRGDHDTRAPVSTIDEVGDLAKAFNRMVDEIQESERRFKTIFETIPDAVNILRLSDRKHTSVNKEFERITGYVRDEVVDKTTQDLNIYVNPESRDSLYIMFEKDGKVRNFEADVIMKDGTIRTVLISADMITLEGEPHLLAISRDITKLKEAEKALRESEERYRILFNAGSDAILVSGLDDANLPSSLYAVNDVACEMLGMSRAQLMKMNLVDIEKPMDIEMRKQVIRKLLAEKRVIFETTYMHSSGQDVPVEVSSHVFDLYDNPAIISIARNIAERKLVEEERAKIQTKLIQANKMTSLGLMVSSLAHEINNPNNTIMFNLRRFARTWDDILPILEEYFEEKGDFDVGDVPFSELSSIYPQLIMGTLESSEMIKAIIENLKGFVKQSADTLDFSVAVNDVVRSAVSLLESQVRKGIGRLEVDLEENLPKIKGNPQKLVQVMVNLISNALEALTEDHQRVRVSTSFDAEESLLQLSVEDDGEGMTKNQIKKSVEPFYSTKHDSGGTGLGLTISKMLLDEHGAALQIDSVPGHGTKVTVTLKVDG